MKRTQVYIDLPTYQRTKAAAEAKGQTVSELIRASLAQEVAAKKTVEPEKLLEQFYRKHRFPKRTPKDLSANIDKYLYDPAFS